MAHIAGSTHRAQRTHNREPHGGDSTDNRFDATVAEQIKDGKLQDGAIEAFTSQIASLSSPRDRAHQKNELRRAIRNNPDLSPTERRSAITSLNQSLAKMPRGGTVQPAAIDSASAPANTAETAAVAKTLATDTDLGAEAKIDAASNRIRNSTFMLSHVPVRA